MKAKSLILVLFIFILSSTLTAQSGPEDILDNFFNLFEQNVDEAIDYLFSTNELIDPKQEGIRAIKDRMDLSRKLLGKYYGHEIVKEYRAGYSYRKYIYSLKYERQPLKIELVLYKPDDKWKVQNVNFHDDLNSDFKETDLSPIK